MGRLGDLEVKMNSPSVLLLSLLLLPSIGGANAKARQDSSFGSTGFVASCERPVFLGRSIVSRAVRSLGPRDLGFEESAWTGQDEINAHRLGSKNNLGEVTVGEFKQFDGRHMLQYRQPVTIPDGGAE